MRGRFGAVPDVIILCLLPFLYPVAAFLSSSSHYLNHHPTGLFSSARPVIDWVAQQTLQELVPKEDAYKIIDELIHNETLLDSTEAYFDKNWDSLESRIRNEDQTLQQLLGPSASQRIMDSVVDLKYDKDVVSTFLNSNAINSLFAKILYDGISEFTQRIDIFGNIVNTLPIIGPIRKQVTQQFKQQLDKSLGPLIQNFLKVYTKVAIQEAIDFVLANEALFSSANQNLVKNLLNRPINTLVPSKDVSDELKNQVFVYIRNDVNMTTVERYLDLVYDVLEEKSLGDAVNVNTVLDASPTLSAILDSVWTKMKSADEAS